MELLSPSPTPGESPCRDFSSGLSLGSFRRGFYRTVHTEVKTSRRSPETVEEANNKVYVAVGNSFQKAVVLLQWACRTFGNSEICILHVHQPSPLIPTPVGRLPVSQANAEVVSAFRNEEREVVRQRLYNYLNVCWQFKVKASIVTIEAGEVQKGIVDLVNEHNIRNLVIGAIPDMKAKKSSQKASYLARNVPLFSEILFVYKGKLVLTRKNSQFAKSVAAQSRFSCNNEVVPIPKSPGSSSVTHIPSAGIKNLTRVQRIPTDGASVLTVLNPTSSSTSIAYTSVGQKVSQEPETTCAEKSLNEQLADIECKFQSSRYEAFAEVLKRKKLEADAAEAMRKVRIFEHNHAREIKLRKEAERVLSTAIHEQEKLTKERDRMTCELQKAKRNITILESRTTETNNQYEEVATKLKLIQASISTLKQEKQVLQQQKNELVNHQKSHEQGEVACVNGAIEFTKYSMELVEFSFSDLQIATCNFSESFKIGESGYGTVYKGELLDRTVVIKKLHTHNLQRQPEFLQQVQVLGKLHHHHLVTLLGICPESWSLIYEYSPGGSLHDRLFHKTNIGHLSWKTRAKIVADIAKGLLFLHSSNPEKIVHGNLKPENILIDSDNRCKICDFGIYRLILPQTLCCPSFARLSEPKGVFTYTDPEFLATGNLTPKSDIFSFGLIILQILTGRTLPGLSSEVRRALASGNLEPILDSSAGEWPAFVARRLADLGIDCCELNSRDRPELTPSLVKELESLQSLEEQSVPSFFLCPISQEIMYDPHIAADGFSYEGDVIRAWLGSGHDTSPMTNLKLSHLELTPNNSLHLAIRDWLCKSEIL